MSAMLPSFSDPYCQSVSLLVVPEEGSAAAVAGVTKLTLARYRPGREYAYIRLLPEDDGSIQVDCARASWFESSQPRPSDRIAGVRTALSKLSELSASVTFSADYEIPRAKVPARSIVGAFMLSSEDEALSFRITAMQVEFPGAPISRLIWSLDPDKQAVQLRLWGEYHKPLSAAFVLEAYESIRESLVHQILGELQ